MRKSGSKRKVTLSSKKSLDPFMLLCTCDHAYIAGFSDAEMPSFDIDDVPVKLDHIVFVVKIDVDLLYFTVKTSELFYETQRSEDEETGPAHQHERGHNDMGGEKKECGKDVFEYAMSEPTEPEGLREEDMLQVSHVPCREEKKLVIHLEEVVFLCFGSLSGSELCKHCVYFGCTVDLRNNIEGARRIEDEYGHGVQGVKLSEYPPDGPVTAVDDDIVVGFDIVPFMQRCGFNRGYVKMLMRKCPAYGEYLHHYPCRGSICRFLGYNYSHEN